MAVLVLFGVLTAGCSMYQPLDSGSGVPWAGRRDLGNDAAAMPAGAVQARYLVRRGDRLGALAQRFEVSVGELAMANGLRAPYVIYVGQELRVPAPGMTLVASPEAYTVRRGDTLGKISRQFDVSVGHLARRNAIRPPYRIYAGQRLYLPHGSEGTGSDGRIAAEPVTVVAAAETGAALPPALPEPAVVKPAAPQPAPVRPAAVTAAPATGTTATEPIAVATVSPPSKAAEGGKGGDVASAIELVKGQGKPPPLSDEGFLWPINGKVVGKFGPIEHGRRRDGIDIAARKGTPVLAAQDGVVAYAGDGIRGYGRMVLIRHADGYITTYAHNSALLVEVGDVVKRGEVIARVGDSGDATTSMLHFELRKGTKPIDPETRLVGGTTAMAVGN